MKYIKLFEGYTDDLNIGDNTNLGIIDDKTATQYYINGTWYFHTLVHAVAPAQKKAAPKSKKFAGTTVSVDIQPEYANYAHFDLRKWGKYINSCSDVIFMYNGESMDMCKEYEYQEWLINECGIKERVFETARFIDKGYGFFRSVMDNGCDPDEMVVLIRYMLDNKVTDCRHMDDEQWDEFIEKGGSEEVKENAQDEMLFIPDVMKDIQRLHGQVELMGGGRHECLQEVIMMFDAINKLYTLKEEFVY